RDPLVQPRYERLADVAFVAFFAAGRFVGRDVKQEKVIVVRVAQRETGGTQGCFREHGGQLSRGGVEHRVELLPSVDLFDLGVAVEVEVKDHQRAAVLHGTAKAVGRGG